jgi:hypothetical protein
MSAVYTTIIKKNPIFQFHYPKQTARECVLIIMYPSKDKMGETAEINRTTAFIRI